MCGGRLRRVIIRTSLFLRTTYGFISGLHVIWTKCGMKSWLTVIREEVSTFYMYRISRRSTVRQRPFFQTTYSVQYAGSGIWPDMFSPERVLRNSFDYFLAVVPLTSGLITSSKR